MSDLLPPALRYHAGHQARLAETLLHQNNPLKAQDVLKIPPTEGTPAERSERLKLLSVALDRLGNSAASSKLNREIIAFSPQRSWAVMIEAARFAISGDHALAVRYFHAAVNFGLVTPVQAYKIGFQPSPDQLSIDFLYHYYPQWQVHHHAIASAMIEGLAQSSLEGARLFAPDPIFDDDNVSLQHQLIESILKDHWHRFEAGDIALPPQAKTYAEKISHRSAPLKKGLLVAPQSFTRNQTQLESEVFRCFTESAAETNVNLQFLDTGKLIQHDQAFEHLATLIADHDFDFILFDCDPDADLLKLLGPKKLNTLKQQHHLTFVYFWHDTHIHFKQDPDGWNAIADLIITCPCDGLYPRLYDLKGIRHQMSLNPLPKSLLPKADMQEKDLDFFFSGSAGASRMAMVDAVSSLSDKCVIAINNLDPRPEPMAIDRYFDLMGRAKLTVNSSYTFEQLAPRGRTMEAAACGVVTLEFGGAFAEESFIPFIHYIPVANKAQTRAYARFLLDHPDWCQRIGTAAADFHRDHYSARHFWAYLCAIMPTAEVSCLTKTDTLE